MLISPDKTVLILIFFLMILFFTHCESSSYQSNMQLKHIEDSQEPLHKDYIIISINGILYLKIQQDTI